MTPDMFGEFLTVGEVAAYLRVSKMTVYRLLTEGELEHIQVLRTKRIPAQALRDYLEKAKR